MHLAHPVYVKPFAKKHVKTDKVDARVLAQLLRMDYLPESYVPGKEIRDQRVMIRHHASLVRLRTSIKNRVHALLAIEGIQTSKFSDLFGEERDGVPERSETSASEKGCIPDSYRPLKKGYGFDCWSGKVTYFQF